MLAAVFRSGAFVVDEVPEPALGAGQLLIRIEATGICGSDLSAAHHAQQFLQSAQDSGTALYQFDPARDLVFGHEYAGRVLEVGAGVETFRVGDRVAGYAVVIDDKGVPRLCGYSNTYTGGFAERMVIQADMARRVPDGLSAEVASLAEPLSVGEMSVQRSQISAENSALVVGCGSVGLGVVAALAARRVQNIVVVEPSPERRDRALRMGATAVLHPDQANLAEKWKSDAGADAKLVAWECTGKPGLLNWLMHLVPPQTRIMVDGSCMVDDTIRPVVGVYKGLLIDFGQGATVDAYDISLERLATRVIDASQLITAEVGLDQVGDAFEWLARPNEHVKIIVKPELTRRG
jgi:(R,R)-butanediol dehydrogenase / meso-butanediol dehydrogenase / diacetyl reductase